MIKKLSLKLLIPEKTIDLVITNQLTSAFQATSTHNSIELSGFGKFVFHQKKAHQQMEKYQAQKLAYESLIQSAATLEAKQNATWRLNTVLRNIEHLKPKLR